MTFSEVVEKAGLRLATLIFKESLGEDFEKDVSFAEWLAVIKAIQKRETNTAEAVLIARERLKSLAKTYSEWADVLVETKYSSIHGQSDKINDILNEMLYATVSIKECEAFLNLFQRESPTYSIFELALLEKSSLLARTFADWSWIISISNNYGDVRKLCLENMEKTASNFDEWLLVFRSSSGNGKVYRAAFQKLVELSK